MGSRPTSTRSPRTRDDRHPVPLDADPVRADVVEGVLRPDPRPVLGQGRSSSTRRGDVFIFPLKMLGYSLNSVEPSRARGGAQDPARLAPHLLALDSDTYRPDMARGRRRWAWAGPARSGQRAEGHRRTWATSCPRRARCSGWTPGSCSTDAPHPNGGLRLAELHPATRDPGRGDELQPATPRPTTRPRRTSSPEILADPAIFPPDDAVAKLEGAQDTSSSTAAQRHLGGVQVEDRRLVDRSADDRMASRLMAATATPIEHREPAASRLRNRLLTFALLLPAGPVVPVLLVAAAGDRGHLHVRHPGEERRLRSRLRARQLRAARSRSADPFITSLQMAIAGTIGCLLVGLPLAYFLATRAGRSKGLLHPPARHPVLDELPHPDLRLADHPRARTGLAGFIGDAHRRPGLPDPGHAGRGPARASSTATCR